MKAYALHQPSRPRHVRVPAFLPVPLRTRSDGWISARQATFLVALAATGSVSAAARKVGMARESAYRLRRRCGAESFAAAWDMVLGSRVSGRKVTAEERMRAALEGRIKPVVWRGECVGMVQKPDNSGFLGLFKRLTRGSGGDVG